MNILILGDEKKALYHPLGRVIHGVYQALEEQYGLTVCTNYRSLSSETLGHYPILISYIDSYMELNGYEDVLADYILKGGRYLALHCGIITPEKSRLEQALGGNFITHPAYCELAYEDLPEKKTFSMGEEPYMVTQTDRENHIFLTFSYEGRKYPAGWIRKSGEGFAAYLAPGHDARTADRPEFQALLLQTVRMLEQA